MLLQLAHNAFLGLFTARDNKQAMVVAAAVAVEGAAVDERRVIYDGVGDDCIVLLRHVLPLLQTAPDLVDPVIRDLDEWHQRSRDSSLERILSSFITGLVQPKRVLWAQHCVQALALVLGASAVSVQQTAVPVTARSEALTQQLCSCVQFALKTYRLLAPPFHGDVLLSLMELLHVSLEDQRRSEFGALILVTLSSLQHLVAVMPVTKLVLYPQVLWVSVALLNHCRDSTLYAASLELLIAVLDKPGFATNRLLQDVLLWQAPRTMERRAKLGAAHARVERGPRRRPDTGLDAVRGLRVSLATVACLSRARGRARRHLDDRIAATTAGIIVFSAGWCDKRALTRRSAAVDDGDCRARRDALAFRMEGTRCATTERRLRGADEDTTTDRQRHTTTRARARSTRYTSSIGVYRGLRECVCGGSTVRCRP
ncbi:hypothetical protein PINS_up018212 [Pythium insidiosum]|nr:hypothetical protein PINS_up018212 [Pythium insidiosum]